MINSKQFMVIGKEIRQIVQPMECLIEKTKHKGKRCTKFFSNEAGLKQHHCEPPIKKEKCSHYGKTINRTNNLEKHEVWEGSYTPCQTTITLNDPGWIQFIQEWPFNI